MPCVITVIDEALTLVTALLCLKSIMSLQSFTPQHGMIQGYVIDFVYSQASFLPSNKKRRLMYSLLNIPIIIAAVSQRMITIIVQH